METKNIRTLPSLIEYLSNGQRAKYVFFWGHQKKKGNDISKACFSQWYDAPFYIKDKYYKTAEHYMMAEKARLFNDELSEQAVIASSNPGAAKQLGRNVRGFNEEIWQKERFRIVVEANLAKFKQHEALNSYLLGTGNRILVEASPVDKIWGIGLAEDHEHADNPFKWKGLNLLGFALMEVRTRLENEH